MACVPVSAGRARANPSLGRDGASALGVKLFVARAAVCIVELTSAPANTPEQTVAAVRITTHSGTWCGLGLVTGPSTDTTAQPPLPKSNKSIASRISPLFRGQRTSRRTAATSASGQYRQARARLVCPRCGLSDIRGCDLLGCRFSRAGLKTPENFFQKVGSPRVLHSSNHVRAVGIYLSIYLTPKVPPARSDTMLVISIPPYIPYCPTHFSPAVHHYGATTKNESAISNSNRIGPITLGKLWIEPDRLVEVLDGAVVLAFGLIRKSTAGIEGRNVSGSVSPRGDCPRARGNGNNSIA
jgi:hypothetical protein